MSQVFQKNLLRKVNSESFVIFIISFGFAISANLANIHVTHLMYGSADGILYGSTLVSPDNVWYLHQFKNYLNGLGFTIDPLDPIYAVRRTPGYPIFYGLHFMFFGEALAHKIIPYTQTFLHAFAAVYLFKTAKLLFSNSRVAYWAGVLYGLSPFVVSFLFMTITESLFPAIIILSLYLVVSSYINNSLTRSIYGGIVMALAVLISPRIILLLLFVMPLSIYFKHLQKAQLIKINIAFISAFIITMTPWTIRNYIVMDRFVPLETYYLNHTSEDQNIKLISLTDWWATWGSPDKDRLHAQLAADLYSDTPNKSIDLFINNEVPNWVFGIENKSHLKALLTEYHNCMLRSKELNGGRRLRYQEQPDPCEFKVSAGFDAFAEKIRDQHPIHAYIISPLYIRGMQYIFHSAIHNWRSFDDYKSQPAKIVLKGFAYGVNIFLWLFSIAYLMSKRISAEKILLGIVPVFSFIFMVYYRHVEGRYLIQIYPFLYLMATIFAIESFLPACKKFILAFR
jgi:hypothetical protein